MGEANFMVTRITEQAGGQFLAGAAEGFIELPGRVDHRQPGPDKSAFGRWSGELGNQQGPRQRIELCDKR